MLSILGEDLGGDDHALDHSTLSLNAWDDAGKNKVECRLCIVLIRSSTLEINGNVRTVSISIYNCHYVHTILC
jgi:hypothetical protein